jgi:hypothetical protein
VYNIAVDSVESYVTQAGVVHNCHEGFGLVVAEALACGTPVIASNMGAMPEIIKKGQTGYLIGIDDESADNWQRAIGWINEGLIDPRDCRADAVARFDRMVAAKRYIDLRERLEPDYERKEITRINKLYDGNNPDTWECPRCGGSVNPRHYECECGGVD